MSSSTILAEPVGAARRLTGALPDLVAQQAERTPDAVAVVAGHRTLTYAELLAAADRTANFLRHEGIGRAGAEDVVGVCADRGLELAVALLAVWRAGATYLPMDPGQPLRRLSLMLGDARADIVLTNERHHGLVRAAGGTAIALDSDWARIGGFPATAPGVTVRSTQNAYLVYTSGSTGRPKGVLVNHAGIANRVAWTVTTHDLSTSDRVLQKTSMSFDAAGWEIFAPLVSGGTVVMAPDDAQRDPAALVRAVIEHEVTVLQVVPSMLRLLVEEPAWRRCRSLRLLMCAGEPLHAELCAQATHGLDLELWNTYGPTECAIDVTASRYDPAQVAGPVSIGRPIDNTRLLVLDADGEPVPVGVPGELYVGGVGLARGYLRRPDLTAERFVPDPFGRPGARLYRTGDVVRRTPDGTLDYVGRADHQIKVNGVRIEPAEIEAELVAQPDISGAVVGAYAGPDGRKRLVAHVVGPDAENMDHGALRERLRDRLPEAMIPSVFVPMSAFPVTASGKVDRAALPAPDAPADAARPPHVEPRDGNEKAVALVWAELLGVERIGVHDDFYQLGGSSILLARLAHRLGDLTGHEPRVADLFTAATVAQQARLLVVRDGADTPIRRVERGAPLPTSVGQRRQWFLDQLRPGSVEWVAPVFLSVPVDVTVDELTLALVRLATRHEALRTTFHSEHGEPYQVIGTPGAPELAVADGTPAQRSAQLRAHLARGFDLARGPIWRAMLFPSLLVLTVHHIACDGWSTVVLERELRELIAANRAHRPAELPELPVQYADFATWQRQRLTDDHMAADLAYWRDTLADAPAALELPTDRPRPAERDGAGSLVWLDIPAALANGATELGRARGATPYMTFLAVFTMLLSRYARQTDVVVGTPVTGRGRAELSDVVGFFLNFLVLRCDLTGDPSFVELLDRVRSVARGAFAHQDLPFDHLVDALAPERDMSRTPLYQVTFDFHEDGLTDTTDEPIDDELFADAWRTAKTDLTMLMRRRGDGSLRVLLEFATALFDRATIERVGDHFTRLLAAAVADPDAAMSSLSMMDEVERLVLLGGLDGGVTTDFAGDRGVTDVFEQRVAATPDAVALVADGVSLTYSVLNAWANRLAAYLRALGVGRGDLVGVCLPRGLDLIPVLLGVLKSGAAYLPLDPGQPADRLGFMVSDADVAVVVTDSGRADLVSSFYTGATVLVDRDAAVIDEFDGANLGTGIGRDDLIYVIYTSGSTGRPKGCCLSHGNVLRLLGSAERHYHFGADDVWPLFHSYAFDVSVWEMWGALLHGGRLVVVPQDATRSPEDFLTLLVEHGVTVLNQTPSAFKGLVARVDDPRMDQLNLRAVVFAGEKLEMGELAPWTARFGVDRPMLINMYGITETTVHSTFYRVTEADVAGSANPIGRPLADLRIYVLDADGNLAPTGVPGEIHVGGPGVAVGYLKRPGLTATRFVPDPFDGTPGARMYRSGDLARRLVDGSLEFLGRIDHQIKIRGFRVEPGEIEAVLAAHPCVAEAAVLPRDGALIGYVVAGRTSPRELRDFTAERLPEYMVPAAIVVLERFPLTANGKLDRRALPAPGEGAYARDDYVAPRTTAQRRLAELFAELLPVSRVGVRDSFFDLGGNSILAVRLSALIEDAFGVEFAVRHIFEGPTLARLADVVEARVREEINAMTADAVRAEHGGKKEHTA